MKIGRTIRTIFALYFVAAVAVPLVTAADEALLPLSIMTENYLHIQPILKGEITIPECRVSYSTMTLIAINERLEQNSAGDVIEVEMSSYLKRYISEEKHHWTLVPVFLLRKFDDKPVDELIKEFEKSRVFPIRTVLAVRTELVEANPWLPEALFDAFGQAKRRAMEAGEMMLPLGEKTIEVMGKNYWTYGVKDNPKSLAAATGGVHVEDLFSGETLALMDVYGGRKN